MSINLIRNRPTTRIESSTNTGPVFTRDKDGYVQARPFTAVREQQPWEFPVVDLVSAFVGPAPLRDPMEVQR
jgi:hypothetical protein